MLRADTNRSLLTGSIAYVIVVALIGLFASSFILFLATSAIITATIALSVGIVYDNAGLLSLCQMTFAGIGAWTVGWLNLNTGLPYLAMLPFAAIVPMVIGAAIGVPALRLRGQNLAVFTLVFAAAFSRVIFADGFPGLIQGNRVDPPAFLDGDASFFIFCALVLGVIGLALSRVRNARLGRWWFSVRRSERATAALGRSVVTTKLSAFAASAGVAGLGGAMLVAQNGIVSGASFEPLLSMTILTSALMFGAGNFEGAIFAGFFGQLIPELLDRLGLPNDIAPMVFAVGGLIALAQGEGGLSAAIRGMLANREGAPTIAPSQAKPALAPIAHGVSGETVLSVRDASVHYGAITALSEVDLDVVAGEFVGLIGPNGAGKSTLVDLITGFISAHEGTVGLAGKDITTLPPKDRASRGLRRSFQQGHTPQDLTIGGYLDLASGADEAELAATAAYFSLPALATPIRTLDVGTRRILEVCGAVAAKPQIVLLDEPAAGLSGDERERFIEALALVPKHTGITVLLIEHDLDAVARLCDRVIVLDFGKVIASGTPDEVLSNVEVVSAYMGEIE